MTSQASRDLLRGILEPAVAGAGFDLEDVEVARTGRRRRFRVLVDKDGGVSLDECADLSRLIGDALDDAAAVGDDPYTLEVSSPGVSRPLTLPRHWRRNRGRLVAVTTSDGGSVTGRVREATDLEVVLEVDGSRSRVSYDDIAKAKVQVEFTRPDDRDEG
jgi:ribosome maturation factor RimP